MKRFLILLSCLALLCCAAPACADIEARGTASITALPDLVTVSCSANLNAADVAAAQSLVSAVTAEATEKLKALGIAEEDIVTEYYSYYPIYDYSSESNLPQLKGYQASHALRVTCRDIAKLDEVIGALTGAGMTDVGSIVFDCSRRHELYLEALELAVAAAREKAGVLAEASGLKLGEVQSVAENGSGEAYYANAEEDAAMGSKRDAGAGIRGGAVTVSAGVTAVFEAE